MTNTRKPENVPASVPMNPPVVNSTTFGFASTAEMVEATVSRKGYLYSRWDNPTLAALEQRLASLEGAERAVAVGSGMAAISLVLFAGALHRPGGVVVVAADVYGGTHQLAEEVLRPLGVTIERPTIGAELMALAPTLPPGSHVHIEVPTNPLIRVPDLPALRAAVPEGTTISVDATFASPTVFRALEHGADLSAHSATKYLGGHHDVLAGVVSGNNEALMQRVWNLRKLLGPSLDSDACYRLWRSLETLELRVDRQCANTELLAARLNEHPAVTATHHPCLPTHPDHALCKTMMKSGGAVVSFELPDGDSAAKVADALELIVNAPSLGGTRTTISWPAGVSHYALTPEEKASTGVAAGLLRLAVGIEDVDALWADLQQALDGLR